MSSEAIPEPGQLKRYQRQTLLNIFIPFTLTLLSLFAAIEIGLRHFYRLIPLEVCAADYIIATYECQPYFEYDKPMRIAYKYKPGLHFEGLWDPANPYLASAGDSTAPTERQDAFWYIFQTDEMGFPNAEYEWRDRYDIIITGDSFVTRTAPKTWIELLAEQSGKSILTIGASSWGTLGEAEAVKMYGLDKKPQWVMLLYFEGNDILNASQYLERRDSGLSWREYDLQDVPLARRLLTPHLANFLAGRVLLEPEAEAPAQYRYPVAASTEVGQIETVFNEIHLLPHSADYETLARSNEFAAVKAALLELDELVRAQGGRFLIVYVPSKEHVLWSRIWDPVDVNNVLERTVTVTLSEGDHGFLRFDPTYLNYATFSENMMAQERLLSDFTQEAGIEFLNLTPVFWQQGIERGELYHFADPHWNQAGNQVAADTIYGYVRLR